MFTIWTVLPVSFVTRGKEKKSLQDCLSFYLEMHLLADTLALGLYTFRLALTPFYSAFSSQTYVVFVFFVLAYICDQNQDYKLELSEINQWRYR